MISMLGRWSIPQAGCWEPPGSDRCQRLCAAGPMAGIEVDPPEGPPNRVNLNGGPSGRVGVPSQQHPHPNAPKGPSASPIRRLTTRVVSRILTESVWSPRMPRLAKPPSASRAGAASRSHLGNENSFGVSAADLIIPAGAHRSRPPQRARRNTRSLCRYPRILPLPPAKNIEGRLS